MKLSNEKFNAELSRVFFTLTTSSEKELTITLKADAAGTLFSLPEAVPLDKIGLSTDLRISGRIDSGFNWANLDMILKKFDSDILSINRIKWNLKYNSPGMVTLTKTGDNIPADLSLSADLEKGFYNLDLQTQDFVFSDYFESSGFLNSYDFITDSVLSGWASAGLDVNESTVEYSGDLAVGKNLWNSRQPIQSVRSFFRP